MAATISEMTVRGNNRLIMDKNAQSAIKAGNLFNIFDQMTKNGRSASGIEYTWTGNACHVEGTSSANSFCNIFANTSAMPDGIEAGDVIYPILFGADKSKLEIYTYDSNEQSTFIGSFPNSYARDYALIPSNAVGMVLRIFVESGKTVDETVYPIVSKSAPNDVLTERTKRDWSYENPVYLKANGDSTARQTEINDLLTKYRKVVLCEGDFYISGYINIPAGCTLEGFGPRTKIVSTGSNATSIVMNNNSTVKNLWLDGGLAEKPTTQGTRYGIYVDGVTSDFWIQNCTITGFSLNGIYIANTLGGVTPCQVSNVLIMFCYNGMYVTQSEYEQFTNITAMYCHRGVYENGGNNKYVGCGFDANDIGIQLTTTYANNTHGQFIGCSINHNEDYAIFAGDAGNGEIFSGCQIHFGVIQLSSTTAGFNFIGCQFGQQITINSAGSGMNFLNHCEFYADPTISVTGTGILKIHECYNFRTGEEITA